MALTPETGSGVRIDEGLSIADEAPVMLWTLDPDGACTYGNRAYLDFCGRPLESILGYGWLEFLHPEERDGILAARDAAARRGAAYRIEARLRRRDGEYRWVQGAASPRFHSDGTFAGHAGWYSDVTECRREQESLRKSEARFRMFAELAHGWEYWMEPCGRLVYTSPSCERVTGYTAKEFLADAGLFYRIVHPADVGALKEHGHVVRAQRTCGELEYRIIARDGSVRSIGHVCQPIFDEGGTYLGMRGTNRDITGTRKVEEVTRATEARIRELEKQRLESEKLAATGRMAARVAHEINNPLAGIKNSFLLIEDGIPKDHPYYKYVGRIKQEIDRIAGIVHQMYDLYRPEQSPPRPFLLQDVIRDVVSLLQADSRSNCVEFTVDAAQPGIQVFLPEGSLRQVLFNLILNAVEASPSGGTVAIRAGMEDGRILLSISDQGGGIPDEIHSRIFEPFFTTKAGRLSKGLGLGLSTSKSLVEAMGGTIDFAGAEGGGTEFRITLPADAPDPEAEPAA